MTFNERDFLPKTASKRFASFFWRLWYPLLTDLLRRTPTLFLNYGYAEVGDCGPELEPHDEPDRPCIQLYHQVASAIDLTGLQVLEISCGHGGGASYVARYHNVRSLHGIDRNPKAIAFCRRRHKVAGLVFSRRDALRLGFPDDSFDAVINIEASHCYPDLPGFLREVHRVLRPRGHLLYADFRQKGRELAALRGDVERSGMTILERANMSEGVVRGMKLNHGKYIRLINSLVPWPLSKAAKRFAGVKGSTIYRELESGGTIYFRYVLLKPGTHPNTAQEKRLHVGG